MNTNILTFKKTFLIDFLKYQLKNKTNLRKFYFSWLRLNVQRPPKNYIPKPSSNLNSNQIVIKLPNWNYPISGAFYLSFEKQKEFEKIVRETFNVIVFTELFENHYEDKIYKRIDNILERFDISIDSHDAITKSYYRLRQLK